MSESGPFVSRMLTTVSNAKGDSACLGSVIVLVEHYGEKSYTQTHTHKTHALKNIQLSLLVI